MSSKFVSNTRTHTRTEIRAWERVLMVREESKQNWPTTSCHVTSLFVNNKNLAIMHLTQKRNAALSMKCHEDTGKPLIRAFLSRSFRGHTRIRHFYVMGILSFHRLTVNTLTISIPYIVWFIKKSTKYAYSESHRSRGKSSQVGKPSSFTL